MKVILIEDVKKQGKKGEIINVKDGYGNFLINNHQAVLLTDTGLNRLSKEKEQAALEEDLAIKDANTIKNKLAKEKISFTVTTGAGDRVFGSIISKQIADELKKKGYTIDKKQIHLDVPISSLGYFDVEIMLHKKVKGVIKVEVKK